MSHALKPPDVMTVDEFLVWDSPGPFLWQLVDGVPAAMAPASPEHGQIQGELGRLIGNHLLASGRPCHVVIEPGIIPRSQARHNVRIPDIGVTCSRTRRGDRTLRDPVLLIEILSPSNHAETWSNIWTYQTIPSVREILVVHSERVRAEMLRRAPDGAWPANPVEIDGGAFTLDSIGLTLLLAELYRGTWLADAT